MGVRHEFQNPPPLKNRQGQGIPKFKIKGRPPAAVAETAHSISLSPVTIQIVIPNPAPVFWGRR